MADNETVVENENDSGATQGTEVEKKEGSEASAEPDYKDLYEKEHERNEQYRRAFKEKKQFRVQKEEKREVENEDEEDRLRRIIREENAGNKLESLLTSKVSDPTKRALVRAYYENRIIKSGTSDEAISDDLDFALNAVDGVKLRKTVDEVKRAKENKPSSTSSAGSSSEKEVDRNNISPELRRTLEDRAKRLKLDPARFIENFLKNQQRTSVVR